MSLLPIITDDAYDAKLSAPALSMRFTYDALAAEPENGRVTRRGTDSGGIPSARHAGDIRFDSADAAPLEENIETAERIRTRDGMSLTDVSNPPDAPRRNASR